MLPDRARVISAAIRAAVRGPLRRDEVAKVASSLLVGERGEGYLFQPKYKDRKGRKKTASKFWWRVSVAGKKHLLCTEKTNRKEARAWCIAKLAELQAGDQSALTADRLTLKRLEKLVTDDYVVNKRKALAGVTLAYRHLKALLGENLKAKDITTARLNEYVMKRQDDGAAAGTINLELVLLGKGFTLAARSGMIPPKAPGWLPMLKLNNARQGFLERAALVAILAFLPEEVQPVVRVAYITGWRVSSELLTRQWRHVDLDAGWMRLEPGEGKTGEGRMFPFTPELRLVLEGQRAYTDRVQEQLGAVVPWVFHRKGKPIQDLRTAWERAREKAGFPKALLHDCRRTAVRNFERAGVPRSAAMKLVGHRTESVYRRYAVVDEAMLQEGAEKLAALHEAQQGEAAKVVAMKPKN